MAKPLTETRCWSFPMNTIKSQCNHLKTMKPGCSVWIGFNPSPYCMYTLLLLLFFASENLSTTTFLTNMSKLKSSLPAGQMYCRGSLRQESKKQSCWMSRYCQLLSWICSAKFYAGNEKYALHNAYGAIYAILCPIIFSHTFNI